MKENATITLSGLPGTDGGEVSAVQIRNVTAASQILRQGGAISSAGGNGAINIWKDDNDQWRCEAMRFMVTIESKQFKHVASVVEWLKTWLPRIRSEGLKIERKRGGAQKRSRRQQPWFAKRGRP